MDFSWYFYIYIGRKWFGLWVEIRCVRLVETLIFMGFDDIVCDIGIFGVNGCEVWILLGFVGFLLSALK